MNQRELVQGAIVDTRQEVLTRLEHRYIVHSDYVQATFTIGSDVKQVVYMHANTCPRIS